MLVDAIVVEPFGCHPSYVQGYSDRDNQFCIDWATIARDKDRFEQYLDEWIFGVNNRSEYLEKLGADKIAQLKADVRMSKPVNYGF
jgi:glutaconate CoA-transferase subunit A